MKKGKKEKFGARKVLFVCDGNVFRSLSAELLLKHYLDKHKIKGWNVFSAGITAKKEKVDEEVLAELRKFGIKNSGHRQHKLNKKMLQKYDLVIAVAENQIDFMKKKFNYSRAVLFNELVKDEKSSIWDINTVKDYKNNRKGVEKKIDRTIEYIHDSIPKLVKAINQ